MKKIRQILCALLLTATMGVYAQENQSYFLHTIEKGQSLYSIASMYGVDRAEIIHLNPGSDQRIYTGRTLRIPRMENAMQQATFHTIQQGETLYRLTVKYGVTAAAICQANPGLSDKNFRIGQVIRIPAAQVQTTDSMASNGEDSTPTSTQSLNETNSNQIPAEVKPRCRDMHKVKRKETIYSISRQYGITEEELIAANPELKGKKAKLKRGSFLCIPYKQEGMTTAGQPNAASPTLAESPSNNQLFHENRKETKRYNILRVAVILPFLDGVSQSDATRMVEYYEGFLLAVEKMKQERANIELYTYNSGPETSSLQTLLAKEDLKKMDIIFGPLYQSHIKPLADFAQKHHIRLVIPFTSRDNTVFQNPYIYQINTPQSYLYSEAYDHFVRLFSTANVIFIDANDGTREKSEFIKGLKETLQTHSISMTSLPEAATIDELRASLHSDRDNIFIPTSGSNTVLMRILPTLTQLVRETALAEEEAGKEKRTVIRLFGYPEWQTYTKDHLDAFFELDTYFYTSFYTNNLLPSAIEFTRNYRRWYGKDMDERYPKFGMLGYDTGYFFLNGLARYGSDFENRMNELRDITAIQTGFKFQRVNNWGGFINRKVFFVHFTKEYELIKLDFD